MDLQAVRSVPGRLSGGSWPSWCAHRRAGGRITLPLQECGVGPLDAKSAQRKDPGRSARGLTVWPCRPIMKTERGAAGYGQPLQCFEVIAVLVRVPAVISFYGS